MAALAAPATMRAFVYGYKTMTLKSDQPTPVPGNGQVRVRVQAAGLNPVDYKLNTFTGLSWFLRGKPVGFDFAGIVESSKAPGFQPGDRVYGSSKTGSLADYAIADANAIARVPDGMSWVDAASLPTAALTTLQALRDHGCGVGTKLLVVGASGGCGSLGVQIGKALGASHVTGVCSAANAAAVQAMGADAVADYTAGEAKLEEQVARFAPYDLTYDTVTSPDDPDYEPLSRRVLKPNGLHVAINGSGGDWARRLLSWPLSLERRDFRLVLKRNDGQGLAEIASWVVEGKVKPQVQETCPFTQEGLEGAYSKLKGRRTKGKLVCVLG